jgi:hypothetical protein
MKKISVFASFLVVVLSGIGPQAAQAAGGCDLTIQAADLAAVQANTTLGELEHLNAEIPARRKLLEAAIDCDQAEIASRVDVFGRLPDKIKLLPAYKNILEDLAEVSRYYDNRRTAIQTLGVWDLKTSARSISAWRQTNYLAVITWADNLLIWADNQQFLERASERLTQVSRVAFSLKLVNQDEINTMFEKAQSNFDTAFKENDIALEALNQKRPLSALAHTQASLKALADTYDVFFSIQEAMQTIIE